MKQLRERALVLVESKGFQGFIIGVIIVNALILGAETVRDLPPLLASWLTIVNNVAVGIFVVEIALRIFAHGKKFFKDPWSWFDLIIVLIALVPATKGASVFRVLRILRVLRLLSTIKSMRHVIAALVASFPGIISIGGLLVIVMYIYSVMATELFGVIAPSHFGDLGISSASLFRVMNGDGWQDIVEPIAGDVWVWSFFISFTVATTFVVLNLFIAVTVEAMERSGRPLEAKVAKVVRQGDELQDALEVEQQTDTAMLAELRELRKQVAALAKLVEERT